MKQNKFSFRSRLQSFTYAFNGLKIMMREEHNARIHLIAALIAIFLSVFLNISHTEWIAIILAIGFVFAMELINSSIENLSDFITSEKKEPIKKAKDLAAAGVMISSITAFIIGIIIFVPKFLVFAS